jgi:hypothetical protein
MARNSTKDRLRSLAKLWHEGKISGLEYSRRASRLTQPKEVKSNKLKKKLSKIDRKYNPHAQEFVQGGLPGLGKRR